MKNGFIKAFPYHKICHFMENTAGI